METAEPAGQAPDRHQRSAQPRDSMVSCRRWQISSRASPAFGVSIRGAAVAGAQVDASFDAGVIGCVAMVDQGSTLRFFCRSDVSRDPMPRRIATHVAPTKRFDAVVPQAMCDGNGRGTLAA